MGRQASDEELTLAAAILSVTGFVKSWDNYGRCSSGARWISEAPSCRVADLRSLLEKKPAAAVPLLFSGRATPGGSLVVLRGRVICHQVPVSRRVSHGIVGSVVDPVVRSTETPLLQHTAEWLHDKSAHQKDISRASVELVPFALVDDEQYVYINVDGTRPPPLKMVHSLFKRVKVPPYPFISPGQDKLVGLWNTESCIQIEKEITAIGICRNRDGYLEIQSSLHIPYFITEKTKDEIVVHLSNVAMDYYLGAIICGALAVSIFGFTFYRLR